MNIGVRDPVALIMVLPLQHILKWALKPILVFICQVHLAVEELLHNVAKNVVNKMERNINFTLFHVINLTNNLKMKKMKKYLIFLVVVLATIACTSDNSVLTSSPANISKYFSKPAALADGQLADRDVLSPREPVRAALQ